MTRMTGPDCVVMCNLINTHTHTHARTHTHTHNRRTLLRYIDRVVEEVLEHVQPFVLMNVTVRTTRRWGLGSGECSTLGFYGQDTLN